MKKVSATSGSNIINLDTEREALDLLAESVSDKELLDKHFPDGDGPFERRKGRFRTATFAIGPHLGSPDGYDVDRMIEGSPIPAPYPDSDADLYEQLMNKLYQDDTHFVLMEGYPKEHWGLNGVLYVRVQWFEIDDVTAKKVKLKRNGEASSVSEVL